MACNCNTASKNCDPCAFCSPPGVTGLTTCHPIDPCEERPDIKCFFYNGPDADCIGVNHGDDLASVLNALLQAYFPSNYCCALAGTVTWSNCYLTGYTIWANPTPTTTAAPTTTSTTTQAPSCSFYEISNSGPRFITAVIQYTPCNCLGNIQVNITDTPITICVNNAFPITVISGTINPPINSGPCTLPPCPTTSTTTASAPCICGLYSVNNNTSVAVTITYTACTPTGYQIVSTDFAPGVDFIVCACSDILQTIPGVIIINENAPCTSQPTTSTTTIDCTNNGGTVTILESFIMDANLVTNIAFHLIVNNIEFKIDWGDGTIINYPAGYYYHSISHTYTGGYSGPITFYSTNLTGIIALYDADYSGSPTASLWQAFNCLAGGSLSVLATELSKLDGCIDMEILNTKTTGNINDLPKSLERVVLYGNGRPGSANCDNTLTGDIANTPPSATFINIHGANTLTGDIGNLPTPPGIANGYFINIYGQNTVWGDIANLPTGVSLPTYYGVVHLLGNNTVTGDIVNLPLDYIDVNIGGCIDNVHTGPNGNTIYGDISDINPDMVSFNLRGNNTLTGSISGMPTFNSLVVFYLRGKSTISGNIGSMTAPVLENLSLLDDLNLTSVSKNITNLSTQFSALKTFETFGPQTITGPISGIPTTLTYFNVIGVNTLLTGNFSNLTSKTNLVIFAHNLGASTITGDITNLPASIKIFDYQTTVVLSPAPTFTPSHTWANPMQAVRVMSLTAMSSANLNNLLVSLASVPAWGVAPGAPSNSKYVTLKGVASGAGLTAITTLTSYGVTVTITP